jgi:hypothetical protein
MKKITNKEVRAKVDGREEFETHNSTLYGIWIGSGDSRRYGVFSYRSDWPIFIWVPHINTWFENETKYSPTTSRHVRHALPSGVVTSKINTQLANEIVGMGHIETTIKKIAEAAA